MGMANNKLQLCKSNEKLYFSKITSFEKQLQLQEREARIEKLRTNLNTASSNKEYQAIKEQIAADEQANSVLSDEILEALERIDELEADVKAADEAQNKAVAELQKVRDRVNEEQPKLEQENLFYCAMLRCLHSWHLVPH